MRKVRSYFKFCVLKKLVLFLLFGFSLQLAIAQSEINYWPILAKVTYKKEYDDLLGIKIDKPIFSPELRSLEGKAIQIKGYIIPTDGYKSHKEFVFSAFPYSSCFFCGAAGPETVLEVMALKAIPYTSEPIEIRGNLVLNNKDINRLMFLLTDVEQVKK
ncbi:MAG: hypothetical protein IPH93_06540 [Saprospiraceae bacterium]|nr:hypothetical protein [Saprospiraceae bacterium]MBK7811251.1 hypothetical protein [Saprospiraceae bacterium]MBK9631048.1 hypothetical protein [Saprospiraceae bacterium]